ncbi:restriction endonuclease subunit S [Paraclostridium bifermentans]|uniref:restriction endonuclease subunit S n=1 Tax=Paraclostridium bifermentans TaxID=1490 RepID=UPI00189F9BF0|nr:restriction endonuclease subunit S [Paraclostridium bifermentans]
MFGDIKNNPIGWEKIKIGDVFEIKTGATPSRKENKYWDNGTIPWIKTTELKEIVINNSEEYITEEGFNKSSVNLLPKNTLLIAMYGQGKTRGMTGKLGIEATTNQACAAILPNPKENMDFIWYQLKLSYEDLRDLGRGGSQPNLNTNLIKSYQLIFPPMELQNKFVQFTKQVDKLKFKL